MWQRDRALKNSWISALWIVLIPAFMMVSAVAQQPAASQSSNASTEQKPANAPAASAPSGAAPAPSKTESTPQAAGNAASGDQKPAEGTSAKDLVALDFDPKTGEPVYKTIQEDWSSLKIGASKLEPEAPLVAQTNEGEGFTRTLIQMKWRPGDSMDVYVILPKGVKNPPAVLYLYGYLDDTERFRDDRWCQRTTSGGVAAIGFVSALSGHRFHGRPMEQWFVSELQESVGSTVHDVHFILDYLAQTGDVDMNRIGMFGQSSGGAIALLAAAAEPRIKVVDVLDPWGDWPVWLAKSPVVKDDPNHIDYAAQKDFLKGVAPLDPVKWLPTLTSTKVRIQQVMNNEATPDAAKDAIKNAAPKNAEVVRYKNVAELGARLSGGTLFDWLKDTLMAVPKPAPTSAVASGSAPQGAAHAQTSEEKKQ